MPSLHDHAMSSPAAFEHWTLLAFERSQAAITDVAADLHDRRHTFATGLAGRGVSALQPPHLMCGSFSPMQLELLRGADPL